MSVALKEEPRSEAAANSVRGRGVAWSGSGVGGEWRGRGVARGSASALLLPGAPPGFSLSKRPGLREDKPQDHFQDNARLHQGAQGAPQALGESTDPRARASFSVDHDARCAHRLRLVLSVSQQLHKALEPRLL